MGQKLREKGGLEMEGWEGRNWESGIVKEACKCSLVCRSCQLTSELVGFLGSLPLFLSQNMYIHQIYHLIYSEHLHTEPIFIYEFLNKLLVIYIMQGYECP